MGEDGPRDVSARRSSGGHTVWSSFNCAGENHVELVLVKWWWIWDGLSGYGDT